MDQLRKICSRRPVTKLLPMATGGGTLPTFNPFSLKTRHSLIYSAFMKKYRAEIVSIYCSH